MRVTLKIIAFVMLLVMCVTVLSGCLGATSVESYGYVLAIGVDKGEQFRYSFTFAMQSNKSDQSEQQANKPTMVSTEGETIFDAVYAAEAGLPYLLNFSRTSLIVVSMDVAQTELMMEFISVSWSEMNIRTSTNIMISVDKAKDLLNGLQLPETVTIAKLEDDLVQLYENEGTVGMMGLAEFVSAIYSERFDAVLPLGRVDESIISEEQASESEKKGEEPKPKKEDTSGGVEREGGMRSYAYGSAVFDGGKMVGTITGEETQLLLMSQGMLKGAAMSFTRDDDSIFALRIGNLRGVSVQAELEPKLHFRIEIVLYARLEMDTSRERVTQMRETGVLDKDTEKQVLEYLETSIHKLFIGCREKGSDAFGLGRATSLKFLSTDEWTAYNFEERYKDADVDFSIQIELEDVYVSSYMD